MQKFLVATDPIYFGKSVNTALMMDGFKVCPGTSYAVAVYGGASLFCSIALEDNNGQILITATEITLFIGEVNKHLANGYWVIPGTVYITNTETNKATDPDNRVIDKLYTIIVGK
ncbi:MAG TPA: hypothetical protein VI911_02495 [Patescibacteria group bacterium]|nr:hypothetical protein [Patescibacteria group bacterium]